MLPHKLKRSLFPQLLHQRLPTCAPEPAALPIVPFSGAVSFLQGLSVVDQEKIDNLMLEMDGTENKCNSSLFLAGKLWEAAGLEEGRGIVQAMVSPRLGWKGHPLGRMLPPEKSISSFAHSQVWCQCYPGSFSGRVQGGSCREGCAPVPAHR